MTTFRIEFRRATAYSIFKKSKNNTYPHGYKRREGKGLFRPVVTLHKSVRTKNLHARRTLDNVKDGRRGRKTAREREKAEKVSK